ncbi:PAS domain S-box protein [Paenibacillus harenae]|uniref:histidine kinase n=1 Tax=Paenibacillus harenae TaxID=306543 RepID=A0ABT9U2F5_PAEHA|nr:PAS domain S-box protein [Paenibacillus harenae]MDQ0113442.1 two-component system, sporulation sensor kinase E [Paenibacillus harenae]
MSIKAKLSVSISAIVAIILMLNIGIYHFSSKQELQANAEQQMMNIAKQVAVSVESSEKAKRFMEDAIGEKLRMAAIAAKNRLDPDIDNVTNEQLVALSSELGVDHITLWVRTEGDIVAARSSYPKEIGASSKTWDYWYTAFNQLFDHYNVSIAKGQRLANFWSGPINFSSTDPDFTNKWGYYYDGTTNYMINPFIDAQIFLDFNDKVGSGAVIGKLAADHPDLLEVTGFDPQFFGKKPIIKIKNGQPVYNLDVRDIPFGTYEYKDTYVDSVNIQLALGDNKMHTIKKVMNGKEVMRSFIPIILNKTYVIGLTFDLSGIKDSLNRQLFVHSIISLCLVVMTMFASYFIAGFMLRSLNQILYKVNDIAAGNFGETITIRNKDELGTLASRVNTMGTNLFSYMTQLKNSATELQSMKQYLESFVNHTADAIHVADLDGRITQVNKAFETMYGWTRNEVLGKQLGNVPDAYKQEYREIVRKVLAGGSITDYETVRYSKSGALIDLSITLSSVRDEQGEIVAVAAISRNITARKQTEELLRQSEKLSVVGQLAAGVAHEVRNPLTTLRGFMQLQKQTGKLSPAHLDIMLEELDRINFIVSEFLVLAKPQAIHVQPIDVVDTLQQIVTLLDAEAKLNNVQLKVDKQIETTMVLGESNQLKQVFINLLKNGVEAMMNGGQLTIEVLPSPNDVVIIRFIDEGNGMSEEDLQRLGEPFFTRKSTGNGLGIMVSKQIIANHKGTLTFRSTLGAGTCAEITLPASGRP